MCASRSAQAGALGWLVVVLGGYWFVATRHGSLIPEWMTGLPTYVLVGILVIGGATAFTFWDTLRWRRLAHSFDFERIENAATETPYSVLEGYRGQFENRTAVMDFHDHGDSVVLDRSRFAAEHDGTPEARMIIEREGAGGTGSSDLPPAVEIASETFGERFSVHSTAPGYARAILTTGVQDAIERLEDPIDVVVDSDRVLARAQGRELDADAVEQYLTAVCRLAAEVEAAGR